jgi:hypothetical protein
LGCAFGQRFNTHAIPSIEIGKTTQSEVVSMLGEPSSKSILNNGVEVYEYSYGTRYPLGFGTCYNYLQVQFYHGVVVNKWKRLVLLNS